MKQLCIFLSLFFMLACATKHKVKQIEDVNVEVEKSIKQDSFVNLQLQKTNLDYLQNYSKNESLMQKLGLIYTGKSNNDKAKVSFKDSEDGLELDIQGTISMALDKTSLNIENFNKTEVIKLIDSISNHQFNNNLIQREHLALDTFKSDVNKKKFDFSFWIYLIIAGCLLIFISIKQLKK